VGSDVLTEVTPRSKNTVLSGGISMKLGTNIHCIAEKVREVISQISKVKFIGVQTYECCNSKGINFVDVVSRLICLFLISDCCNLSLSVDVIMPCSVV